MSEIENSQKETNEIKLHHGDIIRRLKPYETEILYSTDFGDLEQLTSALNECRKIANQEPSIINVYGRYYASTHLDLEAECLSDGSIVYNIQLGAAGGQ